jgi:hypothetical protein
MVRRFEVVVTDTNGITRNVAGLVSTPVESVDDLQRVLRLLEREAVLALMRNHGALDALHSLSFSVGDGE